MEKHYQKNLREEILVDAKPNIDYKKELSLEEKKNILKDIYFNEEQGPEAVKTNLAMLHFPIYERASHHKPFIPITKLACHKTKNKWQFYCLFSNLYYSS